MTQSAEDPVVKEIPVYLSKALLEKLYVFQYPLRSVAKEGEKQHVKAARIKPKLQEIELEIEIPVKTPNYDRSKGEQICINVDGIDKYDKPDHQNFFEGSLMDKIVYTSTKAMLNPGRYAVGILSDDELHLNPVNGILHIKPSFQYLDKSDKPVKETTSAEVGADSAEEEDAVEQITVKFARTESERTKSLREKSYGFMLKKNAEEPWVNTKFYASNTDESKLERRRLFCEKADQTISNMTLEKEKYITSLIGPCSESELVQSQIALGAVSLCQILKFPTLIEKVRYLMANVKLISFSRLCSTLSITTETQKVEALKCIQQVAEFVQGNWVVKSEVIYPSGDRENPGKLCGVSGILPEVLSKARDYILHLFIANRTVNRKEIIRATKLPPEEVQVILEHIALKKENGWEFKLPFDQTFVDKYPEVVRRHELMNKAKQKNLQLHHGEFKAPKKEAGDSPKKRTRRRSRQDSCSSDSGSELKK